MYIYRLDSPALYILSSYYSSIAIRRDIYLMLATLFWTGEKCLLFIIYFTVLAYGLGNLIVFQKKENWSKIKNEYYLWIIKLNKYIDYTKTYYEQKKMKNTNKRNRSNSLPYLFTHVLEKMPSILYVWHPSQFNVYQLHT